MFWCFCRYIILNIFDTVFFLPIETCRVENGLQNFGVRKGNDTPYLGEECEYLGTFASCADVATWVVLVPILVFILLLSDQSQLRFSNLVHYLDEYLFTYVFRHIFPVEFSTLTGGGGCSFDIIIAQCIVA